MQSFVCAILLGSMLLATMATADVLPQEYRHVWRATHNTTCKSVDLSSVVNGTGDATSVCLITEHTGVCSHVPTTGVYQVVGNPNWYFIQTASGDDDDMDDDTDDDDDDMDDDSNDDDDDMDDDSNDHDDDDDMNDDTNDDDDMDDDDGTEDDADDGYFDDDFYPDLGLCIYINQPENLMLISDNDCFATAPVNAWNIEKGPCSGNAACLRGSKEKTSRGRKKSWKPWNDAKDEKSTESIQNVKKIQNMKRRQKQTKKVAHF